MPSLTREQRVEIVAWLLACKFPSLDLLLTIKRDDPDKWKSAEYAELRKQHRKALRECRRLNALPDNQLIEEQRQERERKLVVDALLRTAAAQEQADAHALETGRRVLRGAVKGQINRFGTPEQKVARSAKWLAEVNRLRSKNPALTPSAIYAKVGKMFSKSAKTIERAHKKATAKS